MSRKKLICNECSSPFQPQDNELRCQACRDTSDAMLREQLRTMPAEELHEALEWLRQKARELGVEVPGDSAQAGQKPQRRQAKQPVDSVSIGDVNPEQIPHRSQKRIDATAASLLEDVDM